MPRNDDPLDAAEKAARALRDVDDWDEVTSRTTLPELHVHLPQPSQPDLEEAERPRGMLGWAKWALGAAVTAGLTWAAARFAGK